MPPCRPITCTSALHELKRKIPYGWDLNPYRGCSHGCRYCYAMGTHGFSGYRDFSTNVAVKTNIVEALEKQLRSPNWKREIVNLGGVTDSYQPAESNYQLMPAILKLLIQYKTPAIISTKSDLILRDYDLIDELSRITYINVAATVTTMDEALQKKLEPGAVSSRARFEMLKTFRKTNASIGFHLMPIIPGLTDDTDTLTALFTAARAATIDYVLPGVLYLRGATRPAFFDFIKTCFPEKFALLWELYQKGGAPKTYKDELYRRLNPLRQAFGLSNSYSKPIKEKLKVYEPSEKQLTFLKP
ncbi:SPL family radical SAM protein [Acetobacterium woodii]|uniref:Radical SAM domain protein n=1 Tax=Acetobacterium woodii (strain ATCC 29683 / DSM 1030 / JCM 2381 / KCTC 1655 / WB1) TaxID=931626 RepID=H6LGE9_ACEWD|nr:radical SAM protein [Acetobacterium woodii]AFA47085.1 radical SAM domain protein [Acetobacterium woodii DSM 1030]